MGVSDNKVIVRAHQNMDISNYLRSNKFIMVKWQTYIGKILQLISLFTMPYL